MAEIAFFSGYEQHTDGTLIVSVGFRSDTGREGIIIDCVDGEVRVPRSQPSLEMYPKREQEYMKQAVMIVYALAVGNDRNT